MPAQIAPFLVERVGSAMARRLAVTGARLDAAAAHALRLAHEHCRPEALDGVLARVLRKILRCAPAALAATKLLLAGARWTERRPAPHAPVRSYWLLSVPDRFKKQRRPPTPYTYCETSTCVLPSAYRRVSCDTVYRLLIATGGETGMAPNWCVTVSAPTVVRRLTESSVSEVTNSSQYADTNSIVSV